MKPPELIIIPRRGLRLTAGSAFCGLLLMLWLSQEDSGMLAVSLFGAGLVLVITLLFVTSRWGGQAVRRRAALTGLVISGGLAGVLTAPAAVLLMLLKTAMHSHGTPDYPLPLMAATLARIPIWGAAGLLTGLGLALLWTAFTPLIQANEADPTAHQ